MWNLTLDIRDNERIGIAVSGGRDSMALLYYIVSFIDKSRILAINIEHGIRGEKSRQETQFVINECNNMGVECVSIPLDTISYSRGNKLTIEQAARELRYNEFNRLISEGRVDKVALAHHKGDQAETVMMRILRGTGINGLIGMTENRDDRYIRPFLSVSRKDINHYIKENKIKYIDDDSNANNDYTRNYIRNTIFPAISVKFPEYEGAITRLADNAREDNDYIMSSVTRPILENNTAILPVDVITAHRSTASRSIMMCFNLLGVKADIERRHIDAIINMINLNNGDSIDMPYDVKVYREYDNIAFIRNQREKSVDIKPFRQGIIELSDCIVEISEYTGSGLRFDYDKISDKAVIRYRLEGDYFVKYGGGTKSLSDYMTDIKIPRRMRNHIPLVAIGDEILIISGYQISDKITIDDNTIRQYTIKTRSRYEHK